MRVSVCVCVCVFDVTLCHIITDNLLKLQHTPGNYPGTGCVLLPNPRKHSCPPTPPLPFSLFLPTPTRQLATPRCVCCCLSNFQLAAEYENFVWANLLYGILIVFAQLKLETETRLDSPRLGESTKTRSGKLETEN